MIKLTYINKAGEINMIFSRKERFATYPERLNIFKSKLDY